MRTAVRPVESTVSVEVRNTEIPRVRARNFTRASVWPRFGSKLKGSDRYASVSRLGSPGPPGPPRMSRRPGTRQDPTPSYLRAYGHGRDGGTGSRRITTHLCTALRAPLALACDTGRCIIGRINGSKVGSKVTYEPRCMAMPGNRGGDRRRGRRAGRTEPARRAITSRARAKGGPPLASGSASLRFTGSSSCRPGPFPVRRQPRARCWATASRAAGRCHSISS